MWISKKDQAKAQQEIGGLKLAVDKAQEESQALRTLMEVGNCNINDLIATAADQAAKKRKDAEIADEKARNLRNEAVTLFTAAGKLEKAVSVLESK